MKRRDILKGLTIAPLALGAAPLNSFEVAEMKSIWK
jgi:hypothetical protein